MRQNVREFARRNLGADSMTALAAALAITPQNLYRRLDAAADGPKKRRYMTTNWRYYFAEVLGVPVEELVKRQPWGTE